MEKISAAKAMQVYSEVPGVLRALVTERDGLKEKLASANAKIAEFEERDRIEKIARRMEEKKIAYGEGFDDTCERIKEAAANGKSLDAIEQAVEMTAPDGNFAKLGSDEEHGNGENALEAYLLGGLE
jgi:hypothetical protein